MSKPNVTEVSYPAIAGQQGNDGDERKHCPDQTEERLQRGGAQALPGVLARSLQGGGWIVFLRAQSNSALVISNSYQIPLVQKNVGISVSWEILMGRAKPC